VLTERAHTLHVRSLSKHYGPVRAVDDVSFTVRRGDFLTLLGPSGSGKTTILMAIAGFIEPTAGDILVDDRVITHLPPESRNFGMVFQGYALFPHLSVADNVGFPLDVRRIPRSEASARVRQALDLVHLTGPATGFPSSSRAASSSVWRSRARSSFNPIYCCSTSRSRRSIRSCAPSSSGS